MLSYLITGMNPDNFPSADSNFEDFGRLIVEMDCGGGGGGGGRGHFSRFLQTNTSYLFSESFLCPVMKSVQVYFDLVAWLRSGKNVLSCIASKD